MYFQSVNQGPKEKKVVGGQVYWLKKHLETKMHESYTRSYDYQQLEVAIKCLGYQKTPDKVSEVLSTKAQVETVPQFQYQEFQELSEIPLSKDKEARFYIDIAYLVIVHHLPYSSATHLVNFCKYIASTYDNDLLERCHTSDTTISNVINHCIKWQP